DMWSTGNAGALGLSNNSVWADLDSNNALKMRYLRTNAIYNILARIDSGGTAAWYLTDVRGSVRQITDNINGAVLDTVSYDAYGNTLSETSAANGDRYKWTGRELQTETGLYYNRARFYDPATGRWVSQDPLGFDAGDSNLYRYVKNQPTGATD